VEARWREAQRDAINAKREALALRTLFESYNNENLTTLAKDTHAAVRVAASWRLCAHEEVARLANLPKSPK
jgi:hypothetical protein